MKDNLSINPEAIICNDELYYLTVSSMFKKIHNKFNKAVFAFMYLLNYKQVDVANILGVTETTISRRVKEIKKDLWKYNPNRWKFDDNKDKWEYLERQRNSLGRYCKEKPQFTR